MRRLIAIGVVLSAGLLVGCGPPPPTGPDGAACELERRTIETALEAYAADPGPGYPDTLDQLVGLYLETDKITLLWEYTSSGVEYALEGPC